MINKPLNSIVKADLDALITNRVAEGKTIEYKRIVPAPASDDQKIKILAAISAFANTVGGDLIFGIDAPDGIPTSLPGIPFASLDDAKLMLEGSMGTGINPRVTNYGFFAVEIGEGKAVLILRVQKSWTSPHMVTSSGRFYGRHSSGKYPLDVSEIRRAILLSEMAPNHAKNFREERAYKIAANEAPIPLPDVGKFILHVIPAQAFSSHESLNIKSVVNFDNWPHRGDDRRYDSSRVNLDGVLFHSRADELGNVNAYSQWFRNGTLESVFTFPVHRVHGKIVYPRDFEENFIGLIDQAFRGFQRMGIDFPAYVFISMVGFNGYTMPHGSIYEPGGSSQAFVGGNILAPDREFDRVPEDLSLDLKPIFDIVWNAFGVRESFNYNADGTRKPPR